MNIEQKEFIFYEKRWKLRDLYFRKGIQNHLFKKYFNRDFVMPWYARKRVLGIKKTNSLMAEMLYSGRPCMISRFGNNELQTAISVMKLKMEGKNESNIKFYKKWTERLYYGAGFFSSDEKEINKFASIILTSCANVDLLGMWHLNMEDYIIKEYMPDSKITFLTRLEPWNSDNPWTQALEGKKILVIHPFEQSIRNQYFNHRTELFDDKRILPEFELLTLKAVQTIAGQKDERFENWFEALEYMYEQAMTMDFDVAIIGCGAYGMPLAAKIKRAGRQAIHLGGVTQILFGIKGKRWIEDKSFKLKFNDNWIFPSESETPKGSNMVENNCYWK